jgi:hypothetical protein
MSENTLIKVSTWEEAEQMHLDSKTGWRQQGRKVMAIAKPMAFIKWFRGDPDEGDEITTLLYGFEDTLEIQSRPENSFEKRIRAAVVQALREYDGPWIPLKGRGHVPRCTLSHTLAGPSRAIVAEICPSDVVAISCPGGSRRRVVFPLGVIQLAEKTAGTKLIGEVV